jgi:flagellar hook-associated protein 1 FlgK
MPVSSNVPGLAASLRVSASADPAQGGSAALLRDGGIADPLNAAYRYNASGGAGFSSRLQSLVDALSTPRAFDPAAGLAVSMSVADFATSSAGWLEGGRKTASTHADQQEAIRDRATQALQSETGVNLDDEMSRMLDIEHSYQASAKLISSIDSMFTTLFQAVGP